MVIGEALIPYLVILSKVLRKQNGVEESFTFLPGFDASQKQSKRCFDKLSMTGKGLSPSNVTRLSPHFQFMR